jgi:hypothetical protein
MSRLRLHPSPRSDRRGEDSALAPVDDRSLDSPDLRTMGVRHRVAAEVPPKFAVGTRAVTPIGMAREEDCPEPGLQLQVSRTIEYVAFNPIGGGKTQRVKATTPIHPAIFGVHDDDAMIAQQPDKFG